MVHKSINVNHVTKPANIHIYNITLVFPPVHQDFPVRKTPSNVFHAMNHVSIVRHPVNCHVHLANWVMFSFRIFIVVKRILENLFISMQIQVKLIHVINHVHNVLDRNQRIVLLVILRMKFYSMMDIVLINVH